jgi:hypothetical protein
MRSRSARWRRRKQAARNSEELTAERISTLSAFSYRQPRVNQLFVIWSGDFPYEEYQLPTQAAPVTSNMQILGLGVGSHEPFVQDRLMSFGINNLYHAFTLATMFSSSVTSERRDWSFNTSGSIITLGGHTNGFQ